MSGRQVLVSAAGLRKRVETVLREHLPGALASLAANDPDLPAMTEPATWRRVADYVEVAEYQAPAVYVTTLGTDEEPRRQRDGTYLADWLVRVFTAVHGTDYEETSDRSAAYVAAVHLSLETDRSLAGVAQGLDVVGFDYAAATTDDDSRWVNVATVTVRYRQVIFAGALAAVRPASDPSAPLAEHLASTVVGVTAPAAPPALPLP